MAAPDPTIIQFHFYYSFLPPTSSQEATLVHQQSFGLRLYHLKLSCVCLRITTFLLLWLLCD